MDGVCGVGAEGRGWGAKGGKVKGGEGGEKEVSEISRDEAEGVRRCG